MSIAKKLGTLVVFGVPAIVGGGIMFALFHNYTPVFLYEIALLFFAGSFVSN